MTDRVPQEFADYERMVGRLDPKLDPDDLGFKAAVILLAVGSGDVEQSVEAVVEFTGYEESFVESTANNLWRNGIWKDGITYHGGWDGPFAGAAFWIDVNVALGLIEK